MHIFFFIMHRCCRGLGYIHYISIIVQSIFEQVSYSFTISYFVSSLTYSVFITLYVKMIRFFSSSGTSWWVMVCNIQSWLMYIDDLDYLDLRTSEAVSCFLFKYCYMTKGLLILLNCYIQFPFQVKTIIFLS